MSLSRLLAIGCRVLLCALGVCCARPVFAQTAVAPPAPPVETAPDAEPGQLVVRMGLPPGTLSASLFLNNAFVSELPGGMLAGPLWLSSGWYAARVSAPALRSYEANLQIVSGQVVELTGALAPETPPVPPLLPVAPALPIKLKTQSSAGQTYRKIIYGIGFTALGLAVVAGIVTAAVCGSLKCKSSSHHDD